MITLLASIAGFIGSIIPEFIKYFKDIKDKQHVLDIFDKQIKFVKTNDINSLEGVKTAERDRLEIETLYANYKANILWVDALNGSVRPVLAYSFFIMYLSVKYLQYNAIITSGKIIEYINVIWTQDDQAIFAGIISFYYGQRTFRKLWNK